jgi:hypothetical protein
MLLPAAAGLLIFVALAELLLWLLPGPHGRLQYMIAGTAATTVALVLAFARIAIRRSSFALEKADENRR